MRFLYGDSTPFPLGYNFLTTLEAFMASATRIVQLDTEARALARQTEEGAQARLRGLDALDQFHTVVMRAVTDTAQKVQHAHALEYARRVAEFASGYVEEHRRGAGAENDRELGHCQAENERRVAEQRGALDRFLKAARLPVMTTRVTMRLGEGKDSGYQATASYDHPDGIQTSFALAPQRVPAWNHARRVSELVEGVELVVGVDKSWLRGTVTPKTVPVGDWILASFDAGEASFELVLKRKPTDREALTFRLRRTEGGLVGQLDASGPETPGGSLTPGDLAQLDRLWVALRTATRDVLEQREQLVSVSLDGQPVFESGLLLPLVVRLVGLFAGTVREIAKRSPNEFELSLKIENEGGRREEIYLRKDGLVGQLQPLSAQGRAVFAPLGLDSWVPGTTAVPPAVMPSTSPGLAAPPIVAVPPAPASAPSSMPVPPASSPPSGTAAATSVVPPTTPSTRVVGS